MSKKHFGVYLCLLLCMSLLLPAKVGLAADEPAVSHFKMISTIEYAGEGQFRSQAEALFTVRKQPLPDGTVRYFLSSDSFDLVEDNRDRELSFVIDRQTKHLSVSNRDWALIETVNNRCLESLEEVTKEKVGKTWKHAFDLSFIGNMIPGELKFTLKAIRVKTKALGEMVAVRALSEPFVFKTAKTDGGVGFVEAKIGAVYLFGPDAQDLYMSISVFEAKTKISGQQERLRREVATYRTDGAGVPVDLSGLGKDFESLVRSVHLAKGVLQVKKDVPLPQWAQFDALEIAQAADVCAATACEGSVNPVILICMAAARTVALQSLGKLALAGELVTVGGALKASVPGIGALKMAAGPSPWLAAAGVAAGAGATTVGVGAGVSSGGHGSAASPSSP